LNYGGEWGDLRGCAVFSCWVAGARCYLSVIQLFAWLRLN